MFAREYSDRKREPEMMMPSIANGRAKGRVLYVGQCYYNAWYISLELKKLGWKTDVLNWDPSEKNEMYYHGEDFKFRYKGPYDLARHLRFYAKSLFNYDIFHFSNAHGMRFGDWIHFLFRQVFPEYSEVRLLKALGKKIVYTNNGCMDGVSQTSFRKWGPHCSCDICVWHNVPKMCSDEKNLRWGRIRNSLADYQITLGANRVDCNDELLEPGHDNPGELPSLVSGGYGKDIPFRGQLRDAHSRHGEEKHQMYSHISPGN
jgi:hypothetical protein